MDSKELMARVGMIVKEPTYGRGRVVGVYVNGLVSVKFEDGETLLVDVRWLTGSGGKPLYVNPDVYESM